MAVSGVQVKINDATVISALNTPGGEAHEWRNDVEMKILTRCFADSPVADPLDRKHDDDLGLRPPIGDFQRSWVTRRWGNGHRIGFHIENFSDHAVFVEEGRSHSSRIQTFSWSQWGGEIGTVGWPWGTGTRRRDGIHLLRDVTNRVLEVETGGSYTPLV